MTRESEAAKAVDLRGVLWLLLVVAVFTFYVLSPFRICIRDCGSPREILGQAGDGSPLRIAVWDEDPAATPPREGVLFVHGGTARGPDEPAYSLLCRALAQQGFVVVAPWLRGYNSTKALDLGPTLDPARWNPLPDLRGAYTLLRNHLRVDSRKIVIVGHSSGGGYALQLSMSEPTVAGVVSLSRLDMESRLREWPGYAERAKGSLEQTFGLSGPVSEKAFQAFAESQIMTFTRIERGLRTPDHPPVLFAIGERERLGDRRWLAAYAARAEGDVHYHEFADLTHMLNVWPVWRLGWIYDRTVIDRVADGIARWIRGRGPAGYPSPMTQKGR